MVGTGGGCWCVGGRHSRQAGRHRELLAQRRLRAENPPAEPVTNRAAPVTVAGPVGAEVLVVPGQDGRQAALLKLVAGISCV